MGRIATRWAAALALVVGIGVATAGTAAADTPQQQTTTTSSQQAAAPTAQSSGGMRTNGKDWWL